MTTAAVVGSIPAGDHDHYLNEVDELSSMGCSSVHFPLAPTLALNCLIIWSSSVRARPAPRKMSRAVCPVFFRR